MDKHILTLNGGSSSLKFSTYHLGDAGERPIFSGAAEAIGSPQGKLWIKAGENKIVDRAESFPDHSAAITTVFEALKQQGATEFSAAGHRIVHGGPNFHKPQLIDALLLDNLKDVVVFAPLHLPSQIALIETVQEHYPNLLQVACFDTAFHFRMPEIARRFPLPRELYDHGVMRYGFHGLSYEYIVETLGPRLRRRAIIVHLGNGASMVALKDAHPMDTSMGMTPTGGFMMGTRTGDLDPGVLLYLMRRGWNERRIADLVDHESGLLGVSGLSSEMKPLLDGRERDASAALAVSMFCYQVKKFIGAYSTVLGGLDQLIFTGGIGERAAAVRGEIVSGLQFLGIDLDETLNQSHAETISASHSRCAVLVLQTDEDLMIARHTRQLLQT